MHFQIVEDDDVARLQGGRELGLDIEVEGNSIHRAFDEPWCSQAVAAQASDEGLSEPVAERNCAGQPLAYWRSSAEPRHLRARRGLVNEHEPMRHGSHDGQPLGNPGIALLGDVRASALAGQQRFFYS